MTTPSTRFPKEIEDLAKKANGNPISWKEYDDRWVIVFEDGRKLSFNKADIQPPAPARVTPKAAEPPKKEK